MRISQLAKNMLKVLPVLAVLVATVIGLFAGQHLYPAPLDSGTETPTQFSFQPDNLELLPLPGETGPCGSAPIYTSLPPKCKDFNGNFIPVPGTSSYILLIPEGK